jgi:hypothetical protein
MWFQDLFNYDFRRTEMCIIPYGTQEGEISFCAYNTGIGWRNIIEKMHMTSTLSKWYDEHGRHKIYAGGRSVDLNDFNHGLRIDEQVAARGAQVSDGPANAREEKIIKRDLKLAEQVATKKAILPAEEEERLMKMYRQHVLKEEAPKGPQLVQIGGIQKPAVPPAPKHNEELVGISGD